MRRSLLLLALAVLPSTATAQVSTNDQALDQLKATPAAPSPAHTERSRARTRRTAHTAVHTTTTTTKPKAAPAKPPPPLPAGPPPNPVIAPPPIVMPAHPPPPPPPVPVKADAPGTATTLPGNAERITFGPGSSDLNPATEAAIRRIAAAAVANPAMLVTITAWAAGNNDDPSTPRRLSLDRALAARAVLINAGVISERIHALAKGFTDAGSGPIDRADIAEIVPAAQHK